MSEDKTVETTTENTEKPAESVAADTTASEQVSAPATKSKRKKVKRSVPTGQMHVQATFNNTIISFTDNNGNVLAQSSAGACGFRGSKKGTAYAAQIAAEKAGTAAKQQYGMVKVNGFVRGIGQGRDTAFRALSGLDINLESLTDLTAVAHGGVRPRKSRRN